MAWDKIGGDIIAAPLTQYELAAFRADRVVLIRLEAPTAEGEVAGFQVAMHPDLAERMARDILKAAGEAKG